MADDSLIAGLEKMTALVSSKDVDQSQTWKDKIYLTIDIDWAHDDILQDTIQIIEKAGVSATWFVTHDTQLLGSLRANSRFELGIHPNFNFLLQGDDRLGRTAEEVMDKILEVVLEAKSVRSHSMTQSSRLLDLFKEKGLTHDCNHFIPEQTKIPIIPWKHWNGLTRVCHYWEDDAACMYEQNTQVEELVRRDGLKVFDFHPIHIFLNTESMDRYERTRHLHQKPTELIKHRYEGEGTQTKLQKLFTAGKE